MSTPIFLEALSFFWGQATRPSPSDGPHRPHRLAVGHMDLNAIRKSLIFLGQITNYSVRNRPHEARGLARGPCIPLAWREHEKDEGGQFFLTS